jgi:hypothetical protein
MIRSATKQTYGSRTFQLHLSYYGVQKTLSGEVCHALGADNFKTSCSVSRLFTGLFREGTMQ